MTTNPTAVVDDVETPAPVGVPDELRGLSPEELTAHVARVEAQVEAARAEAKARADAHQERWWSAIEARRRRLVEEVPAWAESIEPEVHEHRIAFEAAARRGDLLGAWSAYLARTTAESARVEAVNACEAARDSLEPGSGSMPLWAPSTESFLDEFHALASAGTADRGRERFVEVFGDDPAFEEFAE